ncbi:rod shape-determining protein MreD [Sphingomonas sp. Leaf343]|uniref:rod shape-determining protein MreD n=1 Tax=Sphingomonas sp. Leaf343 TaxID=1736345 RepID=UPI0006F3F868|nr:rod shape-determining protein MreD [Sphingomonas sp. Leaf343]KQR81327.1 rod shape-determining protein MreD [Sphingomonas sp. Leaf343]
MSGIEYNPFAPPLPPGRARALPWMTVMLGSLTTTIPIVATVPILPPLGLLVLVTWRLLARFALRPWAAAPLGAFDDLLSGQPLGSSVLLWSLVFLGIDLIERRLVYRDFWQDWLIASAAIVFCLAGGHIVAMPVGAPIDAAMAAQAIATILLFPVAARMVAWIDRKRGMNSGLPTGDTA